jgi:polyisoprenyl-phosphate glycosyltransferase
MDKNSLSIVIPAYNEAALLPGILDAVRRQLDLIEISHEIIIVDDGSTDGTWDLLSSISGGAPGIKGIRLSRNFGKESALAAGLAVASGNAVVVMDGDGQHPPDLIPEMVRIWREESADIVEGVKTGRGNEAVLSTLRARLFYWLMKKLTGMDLDNDSDFKLLDRKVVDAHNNLPEGSRFFRGIVSWLGFRKVRIPFTVGERISGKSRWSFVRLVSLAIHASTSFSSVPLHIITFMGIAMFGISIVLGIQTLYVKFSGAAVSGFTTVILLLLFIGSVLMVSLGVIGVYLGRIFEEVKRRPKFVIEDMVNFKRFQQ